MLSLLLTATLMTSPAAPLGAMEFVKLSPPERQNVLKQLKKEELAKIFESLTTEQLLEVGKAAAEELGTYSARVVKRERVDGKLLPAQTVELLVRSNPLTIRAHFVEGPAKGRKVLYDAAVKKDEMRAKEGGILGIAGAIWIGVNSSLARGDSNHPITDFGFSPVVRLLQDCFAAAKPLGGFSRSNDGFDERGRYCQTFAGPKGGEKLYATKARICFDTVLAVPVELEIDDAKGRLEEYRFSDVKQPAKADFSI